MTRTRTTPPDPSGSPTNGIRVLPVPCRIKWWHAGGLHVHVSHPGGGGWSHHTFKKHEWWNVDVVVAEMEQLYGIGNVQVAP